MRLELIHPMLVHFPIALLLIGSFLRLAAFFYRKTYRYRTALNTSWLILLIGLFFGILTIITGEIAEDIVRSHLLNPRILDYHMTCAYITAFLFLLALILDWMAHRYKKHFTAIYSLLYWLGALTLLTTAALGGSLVYEQGAAVQTVTSRGI